MRYFLILSFDLRFNRAKKHVEKELALGRHMETLKNEKCLFPLTLKPLLEYSRQYH